MDEKYSSQEEWFARQLTGRHPELDENYIDLLPSDIIQKLRSGGHVIENDDSRTSLKIGWGAVIPEIIDDNLCISYASLYEGMGWYKMMYYDTKTGNHFLQVRGG